MLERLWRKRNSCTCWWVCKFRQPLWKTVWRFLKALKIELLYDPAILFLDIYTWEKENSNSKRYLQPNVHCSTMYSSQDIEANQVSIKRRMDKEVAVYLYTTEYYSALKNEILPFAAMWVDLENCMLSEISERKTKTVWYHLCMDSKI